MSENIIYKGASIKIGTCENLYYIRLAQLQAGLVDGTARPAPYNDSITEYLKPEVFRYRFPFPDEDDTQPGHFDPYNRGVVIYLSPATSPNLLETLISADFEHNTLYLHAGPNGASTNIVNIPCPYSPAFKTSTLRTSGYPAAVELVQQKLMKTGEIWAVIRCPFCGAMMRLDPLGGKELADAAAQHKNDYYLEIANRILSGYQPDN